MGYGGEMDYCTGLRLHRYRLVTSAAERSD
jgi:hypothetical protein